MPIVPMKQKIKLVKAEVKNKFGDATYPSIPTLLPCRFVEKQEVIKAYSAGVSNNQALAADLVSSAQIYLDRFVKVDFNDKILYTDESGQERSYKPVKVEVKRDFGGKALLTVVHVS